MAENRATRLPSAFHRLAWSNLAAQSAEQIGLAAAPIVAVLALGAGAGATGILQTAQTLPFLLLSLPAGMLVDRLPRPRLMASAEMLRVLSLVGILIFVAAGTLRLPLLALFGFLGATGTVVYSVAAPSLVPALVPRPALAAANGWIELARTVAFAAGPALAGALVAWLGAAPAFAVATALSAAAVFLLAGLREPVRTLLPPRRPLDDLREGAAFVFGHPLLLPVFVTQFVYNTAFFVIQAIYVPYAVHRLGLSATGVGITLAAYGAGMIVGALLAPRSLRVLPFGGIVAIGPIAGFVAAAALVLTVWIPSGTLAGMSFFLIGCGGIIWVVSTTTLRQIVTPPNLLGRVSAINIMAYGARPIGAALGAFIGGVYGTEACLVVAAVGFGVQALAIVASPVLHLERQPEAA